MLAKQTKKILIFFLIFLLIFSPAKFVFAVDDGRIAYHHTDHLTGSNVDTNKDGNVFEVIDYYPFGSVRVDESYGGYENDYKYTGKELDDDTGLYYYGARYYDAEIGRFASADPWGGNLTDPQSLNKYSYVKNNPLMYVDPTGKELISFLSLTIGLVAAYGSEITSTVFGGISTLGAMFGLKEAVGNQTGMVESYLKNDAKGVQQKANAQQGTFFKQLTGQLSNLIIGTLLSPTKSDDPTAAQVGDQGDVATEPSISIPDPTNNAPQIPENAYKTLEHIKENGVAPDGFRGGITFENDGRGGGQVLPQTDFENNKVTYKEWDINASQKGVNRGTERLVTGSDDSAYYTSDHYKTFTKLEN